MWVHDWQECKTLNEGVGMLNKYGVDGWELVNVIQPLGSSRAVGGFMFIFKKRA